MWVFDLARFLEDVERVAGESTRARESETAVSRMTWSNLDNNDANLKMETYLQIINKLKLTPKMYFIDKGE